MFARIWFCVYAAMMAGALSCGEEFTGDGSGGDGGVGAGDHGGSGGLGAGGSDATTTTTTGPGGGASGSPLGTPCATGGECASGLCADEVCCDRSCTQRCEACLSSENDGAAPDGTCAPIPWGADPEDECPDKCNGDEVLVGACDGASLCQWEDAVVCFPYTCSSVDTACYDSCTGNAQCAAGASCDSTDDVCLPPPTN
jgi:hypothetical protein